AARSLEIPRNAECTMSTLKFCARRLRMSAAIVRQLSAVETLVPPNFITTQAELRTASFAPRASENGASSTCECGIGSVRCGTVAPGRGDRYGSLRCGTDFRTIFRQHSAAYRRWGSLPVPAPLAEYFVGDIQI